MFIAELHLYIDYLKEELMNDRQTGQFDKKIKHYVSFYQNIRNGIEYYRCLPGVAVSGRESFMKALDVAGEELDQMSYQYGFTDK